MKNCRTFQCALLLWSLMLWIMPGMIYGVTATGGTISTNEVDDVLHVFHVFTDIGDNLFEIVDGGEVEVLVVAGGGGGGGSAGSGASGAGGGAGGVVITNLILVPGVYTNTVGVGGGSTGVSSDVQGSDGGDSVALGVVTAIGGGGGGSRSPGDGDGRDGGSGGGVGSQQIGGVGIGLQPDSESGGFGHDGGDSGFSGGTGNQNASGGGGGAGGTGGTGLDNEYSGDGGIGTNLFAWLGTLELGDEGWFAGGGGGGRAGNVSDSFGEGGQGGGADGGDNNAEPAMANTGGGGGGAGRNGAPSDGGSGIVVIRYPLASGALGVLANAATDIGGTNATLNGMVLGTGGEADPEVFICWGPTDGETANTGDWFRVVALGIQGTGEPFATTVTELTYDSSYSYRVFATNSAGDYAWSDEETFSTFGLVDVATDEASSIGRKTAVLNGNVSDTGGDAVVLTGFEWWPSSGTPPGTMVETGSQGEGVFSVQIENLNESTTYSFRAWSSNSAGKVWADIEEFSTVGAYHVWVDGDGSDGLSWNTAFTNIQDALDVALQDHDLILITNGVYTAQSGDEVMLVTNANILTISGLGDGQTIIDGEGERRGITMTAAATDVIIEGLTITNGQAPVNPNNTRRGSGIHMLAGTVRNCIISDNTASERFVDGGGVYMEGGLLQDSLITGNLASGNASGHSYGGGIYLHNGVVDRCVIEGNSGSGGTMGNGERGGGVYVHAGTLQNSLVHHNTISGSLYVPGRGGVGSRTVRGVGVYVANASGRVLNCTITHNTTTEVRGAGLWMDAGIASNTIVYANSLTSRPSDLFRYDSNVHLEGSAAIRYSCMIPLIDDDGNIDGDPLFADPENGDFRLLPGSPAINAGAPLGDITADLNGDPRSRDGSGSGPAHDMGAFEALNYNEGPLRAGFTLPVNRAFESLDAELTAHVAGADTSSLTYWWDFLNDGSELDGGAGKAVVTNTYDFGRHSVRLTVSNATENATSVRNDLIQVGPSVIYVVETAGNATAPFNTPATATDDLHAAIDWAIEVDGTASEIRVDDGEYNLTTQLRVIKPLTLLSENGAEATTLKQTTSGQRVLYIGLFAGGTLVDGFTLTEGDDTGGGLLMVPDAIVRNSIITRNTRGDRRGDGAGVYMSAGRLETSEISANRSWYNANNGDIYGAGIHMLGGIVDRCIVVANTNSSNGTSPLYGGGVYMTGASTLQNTLVYDNVISGANDSTRNRGGGVYMTSTASQMLNCTVVDNSVGLDGRGGGLYLNNGQVTNSIVYFNSIDAPDTSDNVFIDASGTSFDYSCTTPAVSGTDNLTDDPLFSDRTNRDYTLSAISTLIDNGTTLSAVTNDLAGLERPQGEDYDIGAYEALPAGDDLTVAFSASPTEVIETQDIVFTATLGGLNTNGVFFRWDFNNNGTFDLEGYDLAVVTNNTYEPGYFTVRVAVSNMNEVAEWTSVPDYIQVAPPIVYVATNGWHIVPFDTPQKAATNIQEAVDETLVTATATSMVLVASGVYEVTERILINRGITVRSIDGPQATIVRKSDSVTLSRIFEMTHLDAVLDGFTIRDGRGPDLNFNGSGILLDSGLVQNCFIIANQAPGRQSWGGGLRINSGGILRNSLVAGNWVHGQGNGGAGGGGIYLVGGRVENCTVVGNRADANTGPDAYGGGIHRASGTITNTIVFFNYAESGYSDLYGGAAGVGFSASPDLLHDPAGTGNITNAPSFFDAGSDFGLDHVFGDYQLERDSAGVNVGTNQTWMVNASDLAGNPRILQSIVDMGAYEAVPPRGTVFLMR